MSIQPMVPLGEREERLADHAYQRLCDESRRRGWPEAFTDDLHQHDRAFIRKMYAEHPEEIVFLWVLRECGTHMLDLTLGGGELGGWASLERAIETMSGEQCLVYFFRQGADSLMFRTMYKDLELYGVTREQAIKIARQADNIRGMAKGATA
jgi:hypothetical protein